VSQTTVLLIPYGALLFVLRAIEDPNQSPAPKVLRWCEITFAAWYTKQIIEQTHARSWFWQNPIDEQSADLQVSELPVLL